jgi:teichuronic acid exporter
LTSLKEKTSRALFWSFFDSFGIYFVKFAFSIAIARSLSPSDYGIVGMIVIFTAIGSMLTESGFAMALIQKKNADNVDYSTVFWFNIFIANTFYIMLFISSGAIADFYDNSLLVQIIRVSAINIPLSSLWLVQVTILSKTLNFRKQSLINILAAITSGTVGVALAYSGFGVWSLVFMTLGGSTIRVIGFWSYTKWRPSFLFSIESFKSLYRYGYKIFLQGMSDVIFTKIYYPLIGKYYSAAGLGYYTYASRFYEIFIRRVTIAYGRVTFSVFASINDENERFKRNYLKIYRLLVFVLFPFTLVLIVSAELFVNLILTEKWLPIVPLMQVFYIEGFFYPLYMLNQNTFNAIGRSDLSLRLDLIKKVLILLSIIITFRYGIKALVIGQLTSSFFVFILSTYQVSKLLSVKISSQIKDVIPIITLTGMTYLLNYVILIAYIRSEWPLFIAQIIILPAIYVIFSFIFRMRTQQELLDLLAKNK